MALLCTYTCLCATFPAAFGSARASYCLRALRALVALVTADALQLPINPIVLSEGLPFLVITIGFEKPYLLTKAFFGACYAHIAP